MPTPHVAQVPVEIARLSYIGRRACVRPAKARRTSGAASGSGTGGRGTGQSRSRWINSKVRDRIADVAKEIDSH